MTILLFFTGVLMLLTFSYALYSNLNQGVVSTLFAITSIYLAILFWIIYRQVMNIYDFIGMIALIVCAILLVFSDDRSYIGIDYYSPAWSVLFGIL